MDDMILSLFITSLIANVAMAKVIFDLSKEVRKQDVRLSMFEADEFRRNCDRYHRQQVRFIDTSKCDDDALNERTAEFIADGYKIDPDLQSNHLIAFVKDEMIKEDRI